MQTDWLKLKGKRVEVESLEYNGSRTLTYGLLADMDESSVLLDDAYHLHDDPSDPNRPIEISYDEILRISPDSYYEWVHENGPIPEEE